MSGLAPAVLFHGFGDSPECWSPLLAAIDEDIAVTTPAAPGHAWEGLPAGQSLTLAYLAEVAAGHVQAAVDRLGRRVVIGGHSMGAATAVAVAAAHPEWVAALYLEEPPWSWPPHTGVDETAAATTVELAEWIAGLQGSNHDDRVQWCLDHNPGWPRDEYDIWARAKAEVSPAVFTQTVDLGRFSWQEMADAVQCPSTLLVGNPDRGSTCMPEVADYLEQLPNWTVERLSHVGHDLRRQDRAAAITALTDVLRAAA